MTSVYQKKPFLTVSYQLYIFLILEEKAPPTSTFYDISTLFEPFVLPKHHDE